MTKESPQVSDTEAAPAGAPEIEETKTAAAPKPEQRISITEACTRMLDKAPGAYAGLYAFQRDEEEAGRGSDTFEAYQSRYTKFLRRPA